MQSPYVTVLMSGEPGTVCLGGSGPGLSCKANIKVLAETPGV